MSPAAPSDYELPESDDALLAECDVTVFRASGPGGQGVNTTDSAVRLHHRPTDVVVVCRQERSQYRNKQICLKRLRDRIEALMAPPPPPRKATRPSRAATERRLQEKSRVAEKKSLRRTRPED